MKKFTKIVFAILIVAGIARADTVKLNLFSLGCPTTFDFNSPFWQSNFNLGVTFTEISHVYIDWSGEITGGLAINYSNPNEPFPLDVGLLAALGNPPSWRHTTLWGGDANYPEPEVFDQLSEFVYGSMPWSELFDGQGEIGFQYDEIILLNGRYMVHGSVALDIAILVVEGTIVPEPVTVALFAAGVIISRIRKRRN